VPAAAHPLRPLPAQSAVHYAKQEAGRLGHDRVGSEHLLLGLLRDQECLAVATLGGLGIAPETVRRRGEETASAAISSLSW
jgi:ATP-dependent Clp protease ATP-binding subunit ClpC